MGNPRHYGILSQNNRINKFNINKREYILQRNHFLAGMLGQAAGGLMLTLQEVVNLWNKATASHSLSWWHL